MRASPTQEQVYCTEEDYDWSFIDKLPARDTYFDKTLRSYDSNASVILHLGVEYSPFWSLHFKNDNSNTSEKHLLATRKDGMPAIALFVSNEPQSRLTALCTAILLLKYARQYKVRGIVRIERSQSCHDGPLPAARFIREALRLYPVTGVTSFAVFPSRDETAVKVARLVMYISSYLLPVSFVQFLTEGEFESWVRMKSANWVIHDLQEFDLFSEHNDHLKYFCRQFDTLRKEWPEDANSIASLLGNAHGSLSRRSTSDCMRETQSDIKRSVLWDSDVAEPKTVYEPAHLGFDSLAQASNRHKRNVLVRKIQLDSIVEKDK